MLDQHAPALSSAISRSFMLDGATLPAPTAGAYLADRANLTATDGVRLHYRRWLPADQDAPISVLFLHGIASHGAWFAETAAHLAARGIAVYAPDRRGSGLSDGPRGHLASYERALADVDQLLDLIEQDHPGTRLFLAGSSWAAKLAVVQAARAQERLAGLLLLGPGLFARADLRLAEKLAVLALHRARPEHQLPIPLVPELYSFNQPYVEYVARDPYRLLTASARFFWETRRLDWARRHHAARLALPILLQIGEADPIMDVRRSCRWLLGLPAPERTLLVYPGAAHTLDFEPTPTVRAYRADLVGWLRRHATREAADVR